MRTDISAPTRLRLSARTWPRNRLCRKCRLRPSARSPRPCRRRRAPRCRAGAARCGRSRRARSACRRPSTVCLPPKFSSIAAVSHGVATSSSIGPLESRHHSATTPTAHTTKDGGRDPQGAAQPAPPRAGRRARAPPPRDAPAHELPPARMSCACRADAAHVAPGMVVARRSCVYRAPLVATLNALARNRPEADRRGPRPMIEPVAPARRKWHQRH